MATNIFERLVERAQIHNLNLDIRSITLINSIGKWIFGTANPASDLASILAYTYWLPTVKFCNKAVGVSGCSKMEEVWRRRLPCQTTAVFVKRLKLLCWDNE